MKLEYLKLKNFRQYYGVQTIRFACDSPRHVTVIRGINGAGKTSLFTALNWCLYGENTDEMGEFVSKRAVTNDTGIVETGVELCFRHEGVQYVAERKRTGFLSEQVVKAKSDETFSLSEIGMDGQFKRVGNPNSMIGAILPADVRAYFFFDGEKIDNFARPGHEAEVQNAVRTVLKIEAIERARTHLRNVARDYRSELKKHTKEGRLQELIDQRETKQEDRDKLSRELEEQQQEIAVASNHKEDVDTKLNEIKVSRQLSEERKQIEKEINELQQQEKQCWLDIRDITNYGFVSLASPVLDSAKKILEEKRHRGEIPSGIRETFLNDLLAEMQCICGRPIQDGSEEHQNILKRLNQSISSTLEDTVLNTASDLKHLTQQAVNIPEDLKTLMDKRRELDDEIESRDERLDEISEQLRDFDAEEVSNLEKSRQKLQDTITNLKTGIDRRKGRIEEIEEQITEYDKKIKREKASEEKARYLQKCLALATDSANAAGEIYERFADDMRKTIQDEAQSIFQQLIWKESHFQRIHLSEDYQLDVIDRYDMAARSEMSAGERQVLSLAFIAGMAKVAREGETVPLVMDTPFGRLSSAHREKITEHLPEIADQLILFVTDEELRDHDQARVNLEPKIGAEYQLIFNQHNSSTKIEPVEQ